MSDITLYLLEVDKDKAEANNIAVQSASKLEKKQLKLIDLITSLEPHINDRADGAVRAKSVAYLADVLENVPPKVLTGQERRLLCDFILGRIEGDVEGIGASARALMALEERGKWDAETAQKVTRTFLDNTNPLKQFKLQTDRYAVIQLFDVLIAKYRTAVNHLHEQDAEFMPNFINYFDGEKDPRNLMIIFSILHVPMTEWDVHAYAQDLFEAVFNYFPITFKPPPDDPYGITAQDLKDRLRDCIAANSDFAPHAFPNLLDKLDSTSMNTKRDVLVGIQACVANYAVDVINLYSVTLWDALKFEILNVQEEDLAEQSLKALKLIAGKFASHDGPLNTYLRPIIKECNEHLEDAPTKQSQAAGRILYSIACAGLAIANKISQGVLPTCFNLYRASESITKRRGLLEACNQVFKAYAVLSSTPDTINVESLQELATPALEAMLRALEHAPKAEVSFRLTALNGLTQLSSIRNLLSEVQSYQIVDAITKVILHDQTSGHGDIRPEAIRSLIEIAPHLPDAVRNSAIPAFVAELPDLPENETAYGPVLEAFAQLSSEQQIFDTVLLRLRSKLNSARQQNAPKSYQQALLMSILYAFTYGSPMPDEDGAIRSSYFTDYVEPLIIMMQSSNEQDLDPRTLDIVGRTCNIVLRAQSLHFQASVYHKNIDWMSVTHGTDATASDKVKLLAPFSLYYYAALRPEVIDPEDILSLLRAQASVVLASDKASTQISVILRHIALLINKFINPKTMQTTLEVAKIEVEALLSMPDNPQTVGLAFAVVKALLVQGKCPALTTRYLQLLLDLLKSTDRAVAARFAGLLAPDDILTKENHCLVSGLSRQKTFNSAVPPIVEAVRTADPSIKANYLIALSGILRWLPYAMLEPSLSTLIPPLLQTLDLESTSDQEVKASALTIFESVLMHDPDLVAEHAPSLITRLLNNTSGQGKTAKVRAKSLQSLTLVPKQLKREKVVPYRRQVVKKLMACLDDPKRGVRAEAVRCRTAWLALDEDEEKDE